jgi:hypothetical protein
MSDSANVQIRITADGSQMKKELDDDIRALHAFANSAQETNRTAVSAVRASIQAQQEYQTSIRASGEQMAKLAQINEQFEARVNAAQANQAARLNTIARGFSILETSAGNSVRSIDAVANAIGMLAFGFGPEGFLVGAIAMAGVAIVHVFEGIDKKIEETDKKFQDFVLHTKNIGTATTGAQLFAGDQTALLREIAVQEKALVGLDEEHYGAQLNVVNALKAQLPIVAQLARDAAAHAISLQTSAAMSQRDRDILEEGVRLREKIIAQVKIMHQDEGASLTLRTQERAQMQALQDAYAANQANAHVMTADAQAEYAALDGAYHVQLARVVPEMVLTELRAGVLKYEQEITKEMEKQAALLGKQAQGTLNENVGTYYDAQGKERKGAGTGSTNDDFLHGQLQTPAIVEQMRLIQAEALKTNQHIALMGTVTQITSEVMKGALTQAIAAIFGGHFDTKKLKQQLLEPMMAQLLATAITDTALGVSSLASPVTAGQAPGYFAAAQTAAEGAALVGALAGLASIGGSGSSGRGGSSSSGGSSSAAQLGASSNGVPSNQMQRMEITVVYRAPDGKELQRTRQLLQRAVDLQQPLRVSL